MRKRSGNSACRVLVTLCLSCACYNPSTWMCHVLLSYQIFPSETLEHFVQAHSLMRTLFKRLAAVMCIHDTHRPMVRKTTWLFLKIYPWWVRHRQNRLLCSWASSSLFMWPKLPCAHLVLHAQWCHLIPSFVCAGAFKSPDPSQVFRFYFLGTSLHQIIDHVPWSETSSMSLWAPTCRSPRCAGDSKPKMTCVWTHT